MTARKRGARGRVRSASAHTVAVRLAAWLARRLPVRRRVLLATAHKPRIDGNLEAIRVALFELVPALPSVALAYTARPGVLGLLRTLAREMQAAYYASTSRVVVVDDNFFPLRAARPRAGTTVVQTWHACGALKKFGMSVDRQSPEDVTAPDRGQRVSPYTVFLASSERTAECYAEAFGEPIDKFVWDVGIPRTDRLVARRAEEVESLRSHLGIPAGHRVVLYAPTFRGDPTSARSPNNLDLGVLRDALADDHVLLLRPHPHAETPDIPPALSAFVIDASRHPEANDLLLVSDALITDYSSVLFEFALLERPIALFAPDHESYERERGFYFDYLREGPGPVFTRAEDVAAYLRARQFDVERTRRFRERWFTVADGRSSERFVDRVVVPALTATGRGVTMRGSP